MRLYPGGKITVMFIGAYREELINDIFEEKIVISGIRNIEGVIYAEAERKDYKRIAAISRKHGVRARVKNRSGLYFRLSGLIKRPGLILGCFASTALVLFMRQFVWHIEIHGNNELTDDYIYGLLEDQGFTAGVYANDTDALDAERKILMSSDKISWLNIEVNGSRADVYLHENGDPEEYDIDLKTPCNIIADRAGVIVDTEVSAGNLMYQKGSGFPKGSVLVSGTVSSGDTTILVHSDAEITADFSEIVEFTVKFNEKELVPTGDSIVHRQIMILGMVFPLDGNASSSCYSICMEHTEDIHIGDLRLPVRIKTDTYSEYEEISVVRSPEDAERILNSRLDMYIYNFLKDYEVLDVIKTQTADNEGLSLKAEIKLRGKIGVKQAIYEH